MWQIYLVKQIMEVSAYLNEIRVALVRPEKVSQISKITQHWIKSRAFQNCFSHSCCRGGHFAPLYPAGLMNLLLLQSTTCLCLFTYQNHMVEGRHDNVNCNSKQYKSCYRGIKYWPFVSLFMSKWRSGRRNSCRHTETFRLDFQTDCKLNGFNSSKQVIYLSKIIGLATFFQPAAYFHSWLNRTFRRLMCPENGRGKILVLMHKIFSV